MTTYDVHQHLWPEPFVAALQERTTPPCLDGGELTTRDGRFPIDLGDHETAARIRALDRDGIAVAVLSLQTSLGLESLSDDDRHALEESWVAGIQEVVSSAERFLAFSPGSVRDGFVGVSLGSSVFADLDGASTVLDAAEAAGTAVFVHPDAVGASSGPVRPAWWDWVTGYPARMQEAYLAWLAFGRERWPTLRVLFAMLAGGGPFQLERLARRGVDVRSALDPNTFFDVSTHGRRAIELCIQTFGVGQLAYGSDTPVVDSGSTLDAVRGFGDAVTHVLQSDTPTRLLA